MPRRLRTNTALARAIGVSEKAVRLAEQAQRISRERDGTWDVAKVRRQWAENTMESRRHRGGPKRQGSRRSAASHANGAPTGGYNAARTAREALQARLLELELRKKMGEVLDAAEVERQAFEQGRKLRDLILALPGRVAPLVAGMTPDEARKALEEECGRICDEIVASE